jgi:hypothetical protein
MIAPLCTGGLQMAKLKTLSRPYPQVLAGKLGRLTWNRPQVRFTFSYQVMSAAEVQSNQSSIFIPSLSFTGDTYWRCDKGVAIVGNRTMQYVVAALLVEAGLGSR